MINELLDLDYGTYTKDNIKINIIKPEKNKYFTNWKEAEIKLNNLKINVICKSPLDYFLEIKFNKDKKLIITKEYREKISEYKYIKINKNKNEYKIKEKIIKNNKGTNAFIKDNILIKDIDIDSPYKIGYNLTTNNIYLYLKSDDSIKQNKDEYIKIMCNELLNKELNTDKLKNFIERTFIYSNIKTNILDEIDELFEFVEIYKESQDTKINDNSIKELYEFIINLINNPLEARINNLTNFINNNDISDSNNLKYIKKEIRRIKKLNKTKKLSKKQ